MIDNYCSVYIRKFGYGSFGYPSFNERARKIDEFLRRTGMVYPLGGYFIDDFDKGGFGFDDCLCLVKDYGIRKIVCYSILEAYGKSLLTAKLMNRLFVEGLNVYQVIVDDKHTGMDGWMLNDDGTPSDSGSLVYSVCMELDRCERKWRIEEFFDKHSVLIEDLLGLDLSPEVRLNVSWMAKKHNVSPGTVNKAIRLLENGFLYE